MTPPPPATINEFLNKKRKPIETIKDTVNRQETDGKKEEPVSPASKNKTPREMRLSPSAISLFLECPRCFWLDRVKNEKRPSAPFPSLPNGMDRVLKVHFDKHRSEDSVPAELEGKFAGTLFKDMKKMDEWRNNFKGLRYDDPETGLTLMGAIDELFVTADGKHAPLDFKTRGFPRGKDSHTYYQHQMDIYSFLLEKNGLDPADFAILIFYHPTGVNNACDVIFDPDPVKVLVDRRRGELLFKAATKCLLLPEPPKSSPSCQWCNWKNEK